MDQRAKATATIDAYCSAWGESDSVRRDSALASVFATNGTYTDPTVHLDGCAALSAHIGATLARYPGARIHRTSALDTHHRTARFAWRMSFANGRALPEGLDIVDFDGDGRIARIIGYFGPLRPMA